MKTFKDMRETASNAMAHGQIGGSQEAGHNPPVRVKRKKFAGCEVFEIDSGRYNTCRRAKYRTERFAKHVGDDEIGQAIREYGRTNPGKGIMIQDESTGMMTYLRLPRGKSGTQF